MPIKRFWLMHKNIDRIEAQRDLRALTIANVGQSEEDSRDHRKHLLDTVGTLVIGAPERDQEGFEELKSMMFVR
jgi:hypothetical protein